MTNSAHRAPIAPVPPGSHRPTWSVMIPTFNSAATLADALTGVLAQDPGPDVMQIEVVDDASTTGGDPAEVVADLGRGRVQLFRQPVNVGHTRNFTTCLRRAQGQYVHLLHGDDRVLPGFYAALQRGFDGDPSVGAAFCRWRLIDAGGRVLSVVEPLSDRAGALPSAAAVLAEEQRVVTPSIAVRRSVYEQLGSFDDRLLCAEDWEMWVRIAAVHQVWYEPAVLAEYRTHADSNTGRHHRLGEELRYTAMVIDMVRDYLPADESARVVRAAQNAYARTALSNARGFAGSGDMAAARAHVRAALRFSTAPWVLAGAARVLLRRGPG